MARRAHAARFPKAKSCAASCDTSSPRAALGRHVKDEHVENPAAQDVADSAAEDAPNDVAQDLAFGDRAARALLATPPPPPPSLCSSRLAEMGLQLRSSVAFGSGCGQALPGCRAKRIYANNSQTGVSSSDFSYLKVHRASLICPVVPAFPAPFGPLLQKARCLSPLLALCASSQSCGWLSSNTRSSLLVPTLHSLSSLISFAFCCVLLPRHRRPAARRCW